MLYCPNYTCQTPNPESYKFCQKCRTLLPHHYLWAVGESAGRYRAGDGVGDRYVCKSPRIFLDTKPGLYSTAPTEIPPELASYPRLSPYQIHVPQIYDIVPLANSSRLLLLDQAAFDSFSVALDEASQTTVDSMIEPQLLPALIDEWQSAIAMRQLNWLWQIAHLWYPLASQAVASTLLAPELVRVEGGLLRLLELRSDGAGVPTLAQLGQLWSTWAKQARPEIAKGVMQVSQQLIQGQIRNAEQLIGQLDSLLTQVGRSLSCQIHLATRTDQGPSRQRNEDACYPPSGSVVNTQPGAAQSTADTVTLVIVCDGIGGHQGGDVASNLAIESVRQQVQSLPLATLDAPSLMMALEQAVCVANDLISQRNDSEQRFDRQRMGTTLVMGLVRAHELYITHVGDSRAYWISSRGCHQVTQDDDVASREVRLGYSSYREALQQPSAGSLVQALGMGSSTVLHPTVQRFILDEDSVFLLCSDGLSDNDRVEETWDVLLVPLLQGNTNVGAVSQQLVELANTRNGHDNVTVGLLHIRVSVQPVKPGISATVKAIAPTLTGNATVIQSSTGKVTQPVAPSAAVAPTASVNPAITASGSSEAIAKTQVLPTSPAKKFKALPLLLGIILLLGGGGLLAYSLSLSFRGWVDTLLGSARVTPSPSPAATPTPTPIAVSTPLQVGAFLQINPPAPAPNSSVGMVVFSQPGGLQPPVVDANLIPPGSVVQVVGGRATTPQERWVEVRVCSLPAGAIAPSFSPPSSVAPSNLSSASWPIMVSVSRGVSVGTGFESSPATPLPTTPLPATPLPATPLPATPLPIPPSPGATSPGANPSTVPLPQPLPLGGTGWIQESTVINLVSSKLNLTTQERGACQGPSAPPTAEPEVSHLPTTAWGDTSS